MTVSFNFEVRHYEVSATEIRFYFRRRDDCYHVIEGTPRMIAECAASIRDGRFKWQSELRPAEAFAWSIFQK